MATHPDSHSPVQGELLSTASRAQPRARAVLRPLTTKLWKFRFEGFENLPESGPAILCPNHISFLDSVFTMVHAGRQISFVGKAEYMDSWKTKYLFPALGMLPLSFVVAKLIVALFVVCFVVVVCCRRCLSLLLAFVIVVGCRPLSSFVVVVHCAVVVHHRCRCCRSPSLSCHCCCHLVIILIVITSSSLLSLSLLSSSSVVIVGIVLADVVIIIVFLSSSLVYYLIVVFMSRLIVDFNFIAF